MDNRPGGPRQPPDKRSAAYESIFGRPGAVHQQSSPSPNPGYPSQYHTNAYPANGGPGPQPGQPYSYQQPDRRTSYASSTYSQHPPIPPAGYRPPPASVGHAPPYAQHNPYQHPAYLGPPPGSIRAKSVASVPYASVNTVQEEDPAVFNQDGLTPAQAYQQQVYLNSPMGQQHSNRTSHYSPHASQSHIPQNGGAHVPMVNLDLDSNGGLGINFSFDTNPTTAEPLYSASELPWAVPSPSTCT